MARSAESAGVDAATELIMQEGFEGLGEAVRTLIDCAMLVALGVRTDGKRDILGVSVALSEAEVHWRQFLTELEDRGLHDTELFISDDHAGLKAARRAVFPSVPCASAR